MKTTIRIAWACTLAVASFLITGHELTLRNGQTLYLQLEPVDPRSLVQGDYMSLSFEIGSKTAEAFIAQERAKLAREARAASEQSCAKDAQTTRADQDSEDSGCDGDSEVDAADLFVDEYEVLPLHAEIVVRRDAQGVAHFERLSDGAQLVAGEHPLRLQRSSEVFSQRGAGTAYQVSTNAWFFQEGTGERYATARYGEFRVDASGRALLAGLRDENLKPLP